MKPGSILAQEPEPADYTWENRQEVTVEFHNSIAYVGTLYYINAPVSISRPVQALQSPSTPDGPDITGVEITPPLVAGENYRILAKAECSQCP